MFHKYIVSYKRGHWQYTSKPETFLLRYLTLTLPNDNLDTSNTFEVKFIRQCHVNWLSVNELKNHSFQVHNPGQIIHEIYCDNILIRFISSQIKRDLMSIMTNCVHDLCHELLNKLRLRNLERKEMIGKSSI